MSISTELILTVISFGATIAVVTFQGAFRLGQIWSRLDQHDAKLAAHDIAFEKLPCQRLGEAALRGHCD